VLIGSQSVESGEQFINEGTVADDDAAKTPEPAAEKTKTTSEAKPAEKAPKQPSA
jgi:hypothetical protein